MMLLTLVWKECREHGPAWVVLFVLGFILIFGMDRPFVRDQMLPGLLGAYGLLVGAMMLASDREGQTLEWLERLARSNADLWRTKIIVGAGLILAQAFALCLLYVLRDAFFREAAEVIHSYPLTLYAATIPLVYASLGLASGLVVSARSHSVMLSLLKAGLLLFAVWFSMTPIYFCLGEEMGLLGQVAMASGLLLWSRRRFCWPDRLRLHLPSDQPRVRPWLAMSWLWWRQNALSAGFILGLALSLGFLLLPQSFTLGWVLASALIGLACGFLVWLPDQRLGRMYLADQRAPLKPVISLRFTLTLSLALLAFLIMLLGTLLRAAVQIETNKIDSLWSGAMFSKVLLTSLCAMLLAWSLAQWVTVLTDQVLTTLAASLGLLMAILFFWMPTLVVDSIQFISIDWRPLAAVGGLTALLLITAMRWVAPWLQARHRSWWHVAKAALVLLLAAGYSAGFFAYRAIEPPDEPWEEGLGAVAPSSEIKRQDIGLFYRHEDQAYFFPMNDRYGIPINNIFVMLLHDTEKSLNATQSEYGKSPIHYREISDLAAEVTFKEYPSTQFSYQMLELYKNHYLNNPRLCPYSLHDLSFQDQEDKRRAWHFWAGQVSLRVFQLALEGNPKEGWEWIRVGMEFAHRLREHGGAIDYLAGSTIERQMMVAIHQFWLLNPLTEEQLKTALEELRQWEARVPAYRLALQRDAYRMLKLGQLKEPWFDAQLKEMVHPGANLHFKLHSWENLLTQEALKAPWEQQRRQRILRLYQAAHLQIDMTSDPITRTSIDFFRPDHPRNDARWTEPLLRGAAYSYTPKQIARFIVEGMCRGASFRSQHHVEPNVHAWHRALQLVIALRIHELQTGRQAEKLNELVPGVLAQLPENPYSKEGFHYWLKPLTSEQEKDLPPRVISQMRRGNISFSTSPKHGPDPFAAAARQSGMQIFFHIFTVTEAMLPKK